MQTVAEGERLPAQVSLNGYSWTKTFEDKQGSTFFLPYTVNAIFPNSGKFEGGTEIIVVGSGFSNDENLSPRCRFGTPKNYAVVAAQVLSFNKMICKSPPMPTIKATESLPLEVPISVAFNSDVFEPFTETHHRFRYYNVPKITKITPEVVDVGYITEVYSLIDPKIAGKNNLFFKSFPSEMGRFDLLQGNNMDEATA